MHYQKWKYFRHQLEGFSFQEKKPPHIDDVFVFQPCGFHGQQHFVASRGAS